MQDPFFVHDADYRIVHANPAYLEQAGAPLEAVRGKPYWEVFPRRDGPTPGCRVGVEGRVDAAVEQAVTVAGERIYRTRMFPVRDPEGKYLLSIHLMEDVTEAERAAEERDLYSRALAQVGDGVLVLRPDLTVRFANEAFCRLVERPPEAVVGQSLGQLCPQWTQLVRSGGTWPVTRELQVELVGAGEDLIPVSHHFAAVRGPEGSLGGYVVTFVDLRQTSRQEPRLLEAHRAALELSRFHRVDELGPRTVAAAVRLLGGDGGTVGLIDAEARIRYRWLHGFPPGSESQVHGWVQSRQQGFIGEVIRTGKPQLVRDYPRSRKAFPGAVALGVKTLAAAPVLVGGHAMGALAVLTFERAARFDKTDLQVLQLMAAQVGAGLEREQQLAVTCREQTAPSPVLAQLPAVVYSARLPEFAIEFVTPHLTELTGLAPQAVYTDPEAWRDVVHPEDWMRVDTSVRQAVAEADAFRVRYRLRHTDGKAYRWVEEQARILRDPEGSPTQAIGLLTDVSAQVTAETALARSKRHYRALFDQITEGAFCQDASGRIVDANPAAQEMLGRGTLLGTLAGTADWDVLNDEGRPLAAHEWPGSIALKNGVAVRDMVLGVVNPRRGERRWLSVSALAPMDPDGSGRAVSLTTFTDITAHRRDRERLQTSEAEFHQARERLERELSQREEALATANARLQELDQLKVRFRSRLSHDLRNPLNSVLGFSELLLRGTVGEVRPEQADLLERIYAAGQEMLDAIIELEAGRLKRDGSKSADSESNGES